MSLKKNGDSILGELEWFKHRALSFWNAFSGRPFLTETNLTFEPHGLPNCAIWQQPIWASKFSIHIYISMFMEAFSLPLFFRACHPSVWLLLCFLKRCASPKYVMPWQRLSENVAFGVGWGFALGSAVSWHIVNNQTGVFQSLDWCWGQDLPI